MEMEYRRLGRSGLKVSVLSFGSWVTFGTQLDTSLARDCLSAAWDAGVNFFDNAEAYGGESERIMGRAIAELGWKRETYVVSTKVFWGLTPGVNTSNTLNRKYLMHAIDGSLERFGLDFVDLLFCHRPDPNTPIEETVWAMSDIINAGKAHYWGTSEWSADEIRGVGGGRAPSPPQAGDGAAAVQPVRAPPGRARIRPALRRHRPGPHDLEPVGVGPAHRQVPRRHSRRQPRHAPGYEWLKDYLTDPERNAKVRQLKEVADELGCSLSQLALAWCAKNPHVSTVITGASSADQVRENMGALDVLPKLDTDVMGRIKAIVR